MTDYSSYLKNAGLTPDEIKKVENMRTGDKNNKKGSFYEKSFTIYQMLKYTNQALEDKKNILEQNHIIFSNCNIATVDDLCISLESENKHFNYQLKNSPTTGRWNRELEKNFQIQKKLDAFYKKDSYQTLVCSDKGTVEHNKQEMNQADGFNSIYYPSHGTRAEMLNDEETELKSLLKVVCLDATQYETALRLIDAVQGESMDFKKTLGDWWKHVIESGKPNIFLFYSDDELKKQIRDDVIKHLESKKFILNDGAIVYKQQFSIVITDSFLKRLKEESISRKVLACGTSRELLGLLQELSTVDLM